MVEQQKKMTDVYVPALEAITPGTGCYLSEVCFPNTPRLWGVRLSMRMILKLSIQSDPFQPNWQETFYGSNYPRLLSIKQKYDPSGIFYALGAVGSEGWDAGIGGPLCKVQA